MPNTNERPVSNPTPAPDAVPAAPTLEPIQASAGAVTLAAGGFVDLEARRVSHGGRSFLVVPVVHQRDVAGGEGLRVESRRDGEDVYVTVTGPGVPFGFRVLDADRRNAIVDTVGPALAPNSVVERHYIA